MTLTIGVLAVQGDFAEHAASLQRAARATGESVEVREVRRPADLVGKSLGGIVGHGDLSRDKPMISSLIEERCVKCDLCYIACRDGGHQAIKLEEDTRLPQIDSERCPGCGLCVTVCPADALTMTEKKVP